MKNLLIRSPSLLALLATPAVALAPNAKSDTIEVGGSGSTGDASGLSIIMPRAGNAPRALADKLGDFPVSVLDFGNANLLRSCGLNAGGAFQAAADKVAAQGGGTVLIPNGIYCFGPSETVVVNAPIEWVGEGRGINRGSGYIGGTLIRTANPTGDVFTVKSRGGAKFRNFAIDGYTVSGGKTAGAAIAISGDSVTDYASGSEITGMAFGGGLWDAVRGRASINWSITNNNIVDFKHEGISLTCEDGSNPDGTTGHLTIGNNVVWAFNTGTTASAGIRYQCGGDVRVIGNKILGAKIGVYLYLTRGPTGTLTITGNSFEEQTVNQIRAERAPGLASTVTFGNLQINSNEISILATGGTSSPFQASIALAASDVPWLTNVTIDSNVFNNGIPKAVPFVSIQDGRGVVAAHNVMTNLGNGGAWAFDVGGNATKVLLDQNEVHDMPAGIYNTVGAMAVVRDTINKPAVASLGPYGDGSEVYVSDGLAGSGPIAGSGTGTLARRTGGAWASAESGAWGDYAAAVGATSGTITTLGTVTAKRQITGKTVQMNVAVAITTNGTAAGSLTIKMPAVPAASGLVFGKETAVHGKQIACSWAAGNATMYCVNAADNTYPGANGVRFLGLSGAYQAQ